MTEAQAVEAMMERWEAGWTQLHPNDPTSPDYVPFALENEKMTAFSRWARVTIIHTTRPQVSMGPPGARRFEARGYIAVQLFCDVDSGAYELAALADDVRKVLESTLIPVTASENVNTYGAPTRTLPTDGRWNMGLVTVPFMYYEQR